MYGAGALERTISSGDLQPDDHQNACVVSQQAFKWLSYLRFWQTVCNLPEIDP